MNRVPLLLLISLACVVMANAGEARFTAEGQIEVSGRELRVFRGEAQTPLFGSTTQMDGLGRFCPAVPLVPGETYRVEFQTADGGRMTERVCFEKPPAASAPTVALAPFPAILPANALKLYLLFSQPMEQGVFLERVALYRQDGSMVHGAFRETELWSPDGRRLTLWLHPGRQKTGVNLNRDEGPVLVAGERHVLKISGSWRSTAGIPLGKDAEFQVTAIEADHVCPEPARWKIHAPQAGTREPATIHFDEPLDPAMLASALRVKDVAGAARVSEDARTWSWVPEQPWTQGAHTLILDALLEDLAGNNLEHPFEVDNEQAAPRKQPQTTMIFDVR